MLGSKTTKTLDAPWLNAAPLRKVFAALSADGHAVRAVGGAVRNTLLGMPVTDIDLATPAIPQDVMRLAAAAGLAVYPTGLDHGTVTVVADAVPFEVTTLRRDVETDGRRAVVAYTTDWREDAARRDFTINAIYCDAAGKLFDFHNGIDDLAQRRVRFIGDAHKRIREDYLRILRFFRFSAEYADGTPDSEGLAACTALKDGLAQLSAERAGAELMKLLRAPRAGEITRVMADAGILANVLGAPADPERLARLETIEAALGLMPDPVTRLAVLALDGPNDAAILARRLRLSNADAQSLEGAVTVNPAFDSRAPEAAQKAALYRLGTDAYRRAMLAAWARSGAAPTDPAWRAKCQLATRWRAPSMPVSGTDVLALGVPAGPRVGVILKAFEAWWIGQDFPGDQTVNKDRLAALIRDG